MLSMRQFTKVQWEDSQSDWQPEDIQAKASGKSLSRGLAWTKASILRRLCPVVAPFFPQFPVPTIWLEQYQQNRCKCVCALPCGLTQTHAITVYPLSLMVLLHVSHRYPIVRGLRTLRDAKMLECKHKTSSQTTFLFSIRHPGLALGFYT